MSINAIGVRLAPLDQILAVEPRAGPNNIESTVEPVARSPSITPTRDAVGRGPPRAVAATDASGLGASSSSPAVVARVTGTAKSGTHEVRVAQLAEEHKSESAPLGSDTAALGMVGSIALSVGGSTHTIAVAHDDSLLDVAVKINTSGARVGASVVFDGARYKLSLRGLGSGTENSVSIREAGVSFGLSAPAGTVQAAQDAAVQVDGKPHTSPTNQFVGAIPGVTLAVTAVTGDPAIVRVGSRIQGQRSASRTAKGPDPPEKKHGPSPPSAHARTALDRLHRMQTALEAHAARSQSASHEGGFAAAFSRELGASALASTAAQTVEEALASEDTVTPDDTG